MMNIEGDKLVFSSGRELYANNAIVGLPLLKIKDVSEWPEGYDGNISVAGGWNPYPNNCLHRDDMIELCEFMLNAWETRLRAVLDISEKTP